MKWAKQELSFNDVPPNTEVIGVFTFYPENGEIISSITTSCGCTSYSIVNGSVILKMNSGSIAYGNTAFKSIQASVEDTSGKGYSLKMKVHVRKNKISA